MLYSDTLNGIEEMGNAIFFSEERKRYYVLKK